MKTMLFSLALFFASSLAQTTDDPMKSTARVKEVCANKKIEYGDKFIKCEKGFDTGIDAPSANFQPSLVGPLTTSREQINHLMYPEKNGYQYSNRYPEISNMTNLMSGIFPMGDAQEVSTASAPTKDSSQDECLNAIPKRPLPPRPRVENGKRMEQGMPLGFRYALMMCERYGEQSDICKYLSGEWLAQYQPNPAADPADGDCLKKAHWPLDPKVVESLAPVGDGIICDPDNPDSNKHFAFSHGEIHELYYQFYGNAQALADAETHYTTPAVYMGKRGAPQFDGFLGSEAERTMDANVGLAQLGVLGAGSEQGFGSVEGLNPEKVFGLFKETAQANHNGVRKGMTMDRDRGAQVWNKPVLAMVVTLYKGDQNPIDFLSTTDFEPVGGDRSLAELQGIEKNFIAELAAGGRMSTEDRKRFKELTGDEIESWASRKTQAEVFSNAKKRLMAAGKIKPKGSGALQAIYRDLTVIYGEESKFAQGGHHTSSRSFRFASVVDANGKTVKTSWNPKRGTLSDICDGRTKDKEFLGFSAYSIPYECCKLNVGRREKRTTGKVAEGVEDYPVFTSALPPYSLNVFDAKPEFKSEIEYQALKQFQVLLMGEDAFDNEQEKAEFIRKYGPIQPACPSFTHAAAFAKVYRKAKEAGSVSAEHRKVMLEHFRKGQFLDKKWVSDIFCKTTGLAGFEDLKAALNAEQPSFCL